MDGTFLGIELSGITEEIIATVLVTFAIGIFYWIRKQLTSKKSSVRLPRPKDAVIIGKTLNDVFSGRATLIGFSKKEPILKHLGPLEVSQEILSAAAGIRANLARNHNHGLVDDLSRLDEDPPVVPYRTADFAIIRALRNTGEKPNILSANVILCCAERGLVYVHNRLRDGAVDTMKGRLHFFGGSYMFHTPGFGDDQDSIRRTAEREIAEETGIRLRVPAECVTLASIEDPTGFVQFTHLGLDVPARDIPERFSDPEGKMREVKFADLGKLLVDGKWVESGQMAYLAWLALGAPVMGEKHFDKGTAQAMYKKVIEQLKSRTV